MISVKLYLSFSCNQYFKAKSLGYPSFLNRKNFMLGNKKKGTPVFLPIILRNFFGQNLSLLFLDKMRNVWWVLPEWVQLHVYNFTKHPTLLKNLSTVGNRRRKDLHINRLVETPVVHKLNYQFLSIFFAEACLISHTKPSGCRPPSF